MKKLLKLLLVAALLSTPSCSVHPEKSSSLSDSVNDSLGCIVDFGDSGGISLLENEFEASLRCKTKDQIKNVLDGTSVALMTAGVTCLLLPEGVITKVPGIVISAAGAATKLIHWGVSNLDCTDTALEEKIADAVCTHMENAGIACINPYLGLWESMDQPEQATAAKPQVFNLKSLENKMIQPSSDMPKGVILSSLILNICHYAADTGSICDPNNFLTIESFMDTEHPGKLGTLSVEGKLVIVKQANQTLAQMTVKPIAPYDNMQLVVEALQGQKNLVKK